MTPPIPPQQPQARSPNGEDQPETATTQALEGKTTIDENLRFEVEALAHVSVLRLAERISAGIAAKLGRDPNQLAEKPAAGLDPIRIVFLNESLAQALDFHRAFTVQVAILQQSFSDAEKAAAEGLAPLAAAPAAKIVAELAAAVPAVTAAVSGAMNLLALFRQDTSFFGRKVEISEPALVVELARCINGIPGMSFRWPGLGLSSQTVRSTQSPYLNGLQRAFAARDSATSKIHELSVAISGLATNNPKIPAAQLALDRAHELYDSADAVLRQLIASLPAKDEESGVAPLQLLQRAADIRVEIGPEKPKLYFLYARVETARAAATGSGATGFGPCSGGMIRTSAEAPSSPGPCLSLTVSSSSRPTSVGGSSSRVFRGSG